MMIMNGQTKHDKSNKTRLESIKHMHEHYNQSKKIIQASLKNVDVQRKQHIIFDDDENEDLIPAKIRKTANTISQHQAKSTKETKKKKKSDKNDVLNFENDDDDISLNFSFDKKENEKLFKLQEHIGRNKRFKIDERFVNHNNAASTDSNTCGKMRHDQSNEVKNNLAVLHQVIGPLTVSTASRQQLHFIDPSKKRYDPSVELRSEEKTSSKEITTTSEAPDKKAKIMNKVPKVSKKQFFEVSITDLKEVFAKNADGSSHQNTESNEQPFSLLNMFGRDEDKEIVVANDAAKYKTEKFDKLDDIVFKMHESNLFAYDSSSSESSDNELDLKSIKIKGEKNTFKGEPCNYFLFSKTDPRFKVAETISKQRTFIDNWDEIRNAVTKECNHWYRNATRWNEKRNAQNTEQN